MNKNINILLGILVGVFFTNAVWIWWGWESLFNLVLGIMCLGGIIINYGKKN